MHKAIQPPSTITISLNGTSIQVPAGAMASTVFLTAEVPCRVSVTKEPRGALCGIGICFECRATVDGVIHRRTCQTPCHEGMRLETQS